MRINFRTALIAYTAKYPTAVAVFDAFGNAEDFRNYFVPAFIEADDGTSFNDPCVTFPNALAEEDGRSPDSYGYIEFEIVDQVDHVPFRDALNMFKSAASAYLDTTEEKAAVIDDWIQRVDQSFKYLMSQHEAWTKSNRQS